MAITTYSELQTAVASWLHRSDLTSQIPDFIALAEDDLNSQLRLRMMEVDETLTLTTSANTVALPSRYLEPMFLEVVFPDDRDNKRLTFQSPDQMEVFDSTQAAQEPRFWTINGSNIEFPEPADQDYTLRFRMLKRLDLAADLTNNLLSNWRGLYLYGTCLQAAPYMVDDSRLPTWALMYENLFKKVQAKEGRRNIRANLMTEVASNNRRGNIIRGY